MKKQLAILCGIVIGGIIAATSLVGGSDGGELVENLNSRQTQLQQVMAELNR